MNSKHIHPRSTCYKYQSETAKQILTEFLTDQSFNSRWLNFAEHKFHVKSKYGYSGCLTPEDYVSEAKVIILDIVIVEDTTVAAPRFRIDKEDGPVFLTRKDLFAYVFLLIKWKMSHVFRDEQNTVPLPQTNDNNETEQTEDDEILASEDNPGSDYVDSFNDPFDETMLYKSKEFIEECCRQLEKEKVLYRIIFEELLDGTPNRKIAEKYKLTIRSVENTNKIIHRRVRQISQNMEILNS